MQVSKKDILEISKYIFTGVLIVSIIQKIMNPVQYENFSDFIILIISLISNKDYAVPFSLFAFTIIIECFIVIGLFQKSIFKYSAIIGISLIGLGVLGSSISYYYGLTSSCGCGLFGDLPHLILGQKLLLLFILGFLYKNRELVFNK